MKITTLKSTIAALGLLIAFTSAPVFGQPDAASIAAQAEATSNNCPPGKRIEGVWDSQVAIRDCQTGAVLRAFRGLGLFIEGGSLLQTNNTTNAGLTSGPSFGTWKHLGQRRFSATFRFFRFNPDGTFAGIQKVKRTIELSANGNQFTSVIASELYDANDHLFQTGCGSETATRVD